MSNALTDPTPETDLAATPVGDSAPGDETAAGDGSAGSPPMVEAARFNGLMSSHQRVLADLEAERKARAALEAQLTSQETTNVADDELRDEVRTLQDELRAERLERAKEKALAKFPEAAPLADLIIGSTATEVMSVAQAIAERLKGLAPAVPVPDPPPVEDPAPVADATPVPTTSTAPVIGGGGMAPPVEPTANEAVKQALAAQDWDGYWKAKSGAGATANLG